MRLHFSMRLVPMRFIAFSRVGLWSPSSLSQGACFIVWGFGIGRIWNTISSGRKAKTGTTLQSLSDQSPTRGASGTRGPGGGDEEAKESLLTLSDRGVVVIPFLLSGNTDSAAEEVHLRGKYERKRYRQRRQNRRKTTKEKRDKG